MILKKTQLPKGQPEPGRQILGDIRSFHKISRRRLWLEVSPALKRLCRTGFDKYQGGIQNQRRAGAAVRPLIGANIQNGLTALQLPGDHPINRAAIQDFSPALGALPRPVQQRRVGRQPLGLHRAQMLDITDTDGEFYQMKHGF